MEADQDISASLQARLELIKKDFYEQYNVQGVPQKEITPVKKVRIVHKKGSKSSLNADITKKIKLVKTVRETATESFSGK